MALTIDISVNKKQLSDISLKLKDTPRKIPAVLRKSLNDTIKDTRLITVKEIKKLTTAPVKRIREAMELKKAKGREGEASIRVFAQRIPLIHFRAKSLRGTQKTLKSGTVKTTLSGVSYQINKRSGRKSIRERPLRFISIVYGSRAVDPTTGRKVGIKRTEAIAAGNKGHKGIFKRVGGSRSHSKLVQLFGPSIGTILEDHPASTSKIRREAGVMLNANVDRRLNEVLRKNAV